MDYEFIFDTNTKVHSVAVAGEQFAVGRFLNTEFVLDDNSVEQLNDLIELLETSIEGVVEFTEWSIEIDRDDLTISHSSQLETKSEKEKTAQLEQELSDLEWDFQCECGKADLLELLVAWVDFRSE